MFYGKRFVWIEFISLCRVLLVNWLGLKFIKSIWKIVIRDYIEKKCLR